MFIEIQNKDIDIHVQHERLKMGWWPMIPMVTLEAIWGAMSIGVQRKNCSAYCIFNGEWRWFVNCHGYFIIIVHHNISYEFLQTLSYVVFTKDLRYIVLD